MGLLRVAAGSLSVVDSLRTEERASGSSGRSLVGEKEGEGGGGTSNYNICMYMLDRYSRRVWMLSRWL